MKRRVVAFIGSADELKLGDLIVTGRCSVEEIMSKELFKDSAGRPSVEVRTFDREGRESVATFATDQVVLIVE